MPAAASHRNLGSSSSTHSPMQRLSALAPSPGSPLSPFTYRWPQDEVKEVVQKAQFLELVRHCGWLLKQHGNGPHPTWSKRWFYLLDDRLCYTDEPGTVEDVRYIPLDRIPVRALPRGYGPQIGVTVIEDRQIDKPELPAQSAKKRACVFSVQCGTHTHFMAASTAAEAQLWVDRITQTWVHCSKFTGRSIRARNLEDSFVHSQQHLLQENAALRQSLEDLTKHQAEKQSHFDSTDRSQSMSLHGTPEPVKTDPAPMPASSPPITPLSVPTLPIESQPDAALTGPLLSASPSMQRRSPWEEDYWSRPSVELVTYELELDTASCKGAGTSAHVVLELFGGEGTTPSHSSGVHGLEQGPYQPIPFGPGQTDAFEIRCERLSKLVMVRVAHDNSGQSPAWFLEEIRARPKGTEEWTHFYCGRWLASKEDDGATSRDIYRGKRPAGVQYHLAVKTGDVRGAGTSANVYLIMHGQEASGRKHQLTAGPRDFDRGNDDSFTVEDHELGDLTHVTVGHDSAGSTPSWHLEALLITHLPSGQQWRFGCGLWFDLQQGDGLTERELMPTSDKAHLVWYALTLCTSDMPAAGSDADVFVTLHGQQGTSPRIKLPSRPEDFLRGGEDTFRMELQALGDIVKMTVGHNNRGCDPGWRLDHAQLLDEETGTVYYFACHRWLSRDEDDGLIERDLFPGEAESHDLDVQYTAEVFTSDLTGAGTDADVSLVLFGHLGDSGPQSLNGKDAFGIAAIDVFQFTCKHVGQMQMLRIGHNNAGASPDWHLDKVIITEKESGSRAVFQCGRWLSTARDDGAICRDLSLSPEADEEDQQDERQEAVEAAVKTEYRVWVHTSSCRGAGMQGRVSIELHGQGGSSGLQPLHAANDDAFARSQESEFALYLPHVGALEQVTVATDGSAWLCDLIVVEDKHLQETVYFVCGRWLGKGEPNEILLQGSRTDPRPPFHDYRVTVITSDVRNSGTDADVFANITGRIGHGNHSFVHAGSLCSSGRQQLASSNADAFSRGATDEFALRLRHMGQLQELHIWHNGTGLATAWHLSLIIVADETNGERWFFPCHDWLDRENRNSRVLLAQLEEPRLASNMIDYQVVTYTSDLRGAGTDATVFVELCGELGSGPRCKLMNQAGAADVFGRGQTDSCVVQSPELGELQSLTIGHDNKGQKPGWHLDLVEVTHLPSGRLYFFACARWLDLAQDDGKAVRVLKAQDSKPERAFVNSTLTDYEVTVHTSDVQDAGTDADVSLVMYGASGESKPLPLKASTSAFASGSVDSFTVQAPEMGPLTHVRVSHNARGAHPDWMLEMVRIVLINSAQEWLFFGHVWLHSGNDNQVVLKPGQSANHS
ncbi:TPA: hypothetical protein ACH3X2_012566 [Trebouxia sp. C0005]